MTKTNIERFDEITAAILVRLYENFPIPVSIGPKDAGLSVLTVISYDPVTEECEMEGDLDPETPFFDATVEWLVEAGFIATKDSRFGDPTYYLTAVGLQSLKHVPQPAINSETLGDRLASAAKSGVKGAASHLLNQALSIGTSILFRKLGVE